MNFQLLKAAGSQVLYNTATTAAGQVAENVSSTFWTMAKEVMTPLCTLVIVFEAISIYVSSRNGTTGDKIKQYIGVIVGAAVILFIVYAVPAILNLVTNAASDLSSKIG